MHQYQTWYRSFGVEVLFLVQYWCRDSIGIDSFGIEVLVPVQYWLYWFWFWSSIGGIGFGFGPVLVVLVLILFGIGIGFEVLVRSLLLSRNRSRTRSRVALRMKPSQMRLSSMIFSSPCEDAFKNESHSDHVHVFEWNLFNNSAREKFDYWYTWRDERK